MMDCEELAQMPLESLLYYVLVGEGRKRSEPAEGEDVCDFRSCRQAIRRVSWAGISAWDF